MRRRTVWLVILSCAVPRLLALAVFRDPQPTLYSMLADEIAAGHGYTLDGEVATHLEPFYPAVLAAGRLLAGTVGMLAMQIAAACFGGVALFAVARNRAGERAAWIATLLYAVSPYLVRQSAAFMEIVVATALAIVFVWSVDGARTRARAALAGAVMAALLLTRFSFLPAAVAGVILTGRRHAGHAMTMTAVALAALIPWGAFSNAAGGSLLPPRIGENLFVSTSAWAGPIVPRVNIDVLLPLTEDLVQRELGPSASRVERDRWLLRRALEYIEAHPWRTLGLKAKNLGSVFLPRLLPFTERRASAELVDGELRIPPQSPRPLSWELAAGGFQALLLAGGAVGIWKRRDRLAADDAMPIALALSVVAVNVAFFPTSRLLAPMTFVLMFYTAVACADR